MILTRYLVWSSFTQIIRMQWASWLSAESIRTLSQNKGEIWNFTYHRYAPFTCKDTFTTLMNWSISFFKLLASIIFHIEYCSSFRRFYSTKSRPRRKPFKRNALKQLSMDCSAKYLSFQKSYSWQGVSSLNALGKRLAKLSFTLRSKRSPKAGSTINTWLCIKKDSRWSNDKSILTMTKGSITKEKQSTCRSPITARYKTTNHQSQPKKRSATL